MSKKISRPLESWALPAAARIPGTPGSQLLAVEAVIASAAPDAAPAYAAAKTLSPFAVGVILMLSCRHLGTVISTKSTGCTSSTLTHVSQGVGSTICRKWWQELRYRGRSPICWHRYAKEYLSRLPAVGHVRCARERS